METKELERESPKQALTEEQDQVEKHQAEIMNQPYQIRQTVIPPQMQASAEQKGTNKMAIDPKTDYHVACDCHGLLDHKNDQCTVTSKEENTLVESNITDIV